MGQKSTMLLTFLVAGGCAAAPAASSRYVARAAAAPAAPAAAEAKPAEPAEVLAGADRAYDSQLGVARGGHFDTERQIAVLREAVLLYGQFLERAAGRPELEPAVRKSRERIADANQTIEFLQATLRAQDDPPPAPTPNSD